MWGVPQEVLAMIRVFDRKSTIEEIIRLAVKSTNAGWLIPIPTVSELEEFDTLSLVDEFLRLDRLSRS